MSIREYHGATGIRLIAETPIEPTEIVTIHTDLMILRASYQGKKSNGYPALSPVALSLPADIFLRIEKERHILLKAIAESGLIYRPMSDSLRTLLDEDVAWLQAVAPALTTIMAGRPLHLILPSRFHTTRYSLGTVQRYEIAT